METSANISGTEVLKSLEQAVRSFVSSSSEVVLQASRSLRDTQDWLDERLRFWRSEVAIREAAYNACLSYTDDDGYHRDCSYEAASLREAKMELENVASWARKVEEAGHRYSATARKFDNLLQTDCPASIHFLQRKASVVERYLSDAPPDGSSIGSASASPGSTSPTGSLAQSQQGFQGASVLGAALGMAAGGTLAGLSAVGRSAAGASPSLGSASGSVGTSTGGNSAAPSLAQYSTNGAAFSDVPLGLVETPQFAPGEWQQADVNDMRHSFGRLQEIRIAIDGGYIDQLVASDPDALRIYGWFFGTEAVKVDWYQGRFVITNGKHRVALARMLGLSALPARVFTP